MIPVLMIIYMQWLMQDERRRWAALTVVCLGQLMMILDATIVNVALPFIQSDLGFSPGQPDLGPGRVHDRLRLLPAAGGPARRPGRAQAASSSSASCCSPPRPPPAGSRRARRADRRALHPGPRRRGRRLGVILALIVTEFPEPRERAKAMSVYTFVGVAGGSLGLLAGGVPHRGAQLALDLLHQPADRRARLRARADRARRGVARRRAAAAASTGSARC